ncbi:uncharacterized protein LOC129573821 [Sitodiplosis mosellana]|uniref:uncharacterized protein LOC129573821 n=1 Tax=Sitodiplosis mosellana TaxID=263140 RepID=UPI00244374EA|nr:uncharacterized protein LOC129573821 [Sitodiplosis mosellana]XP_055310905.1 uncharacterized protein LOC129573821 [Sitodiplosis mosellana]
MNTDKWKRELDTLMSQIEEHSMATLWRIKRQCNRSGLPVDKSFRKIFLRATNERIAETFDRLESQPSSSGSNKGGHRMIRRSRSKFRMSRRSQSKTGTNRRSRSKSRRSPRKSVVNSSMRLPLVQSSSKPSTSQSRDRQFSRGKSVQSSIKKRPADSSSSRKRTETQLHSTGSNGITRAGREVKTEVGTKLHSDSMKFGCLHCLKSKEINDFYSDDIDLVYGHWLSAHTDLPKAEPFQFYVTQLVACHYCDVVGSFSEVIEHQQKVHPTNVLIIANQSNREQCALCNRVGELDDHFERAHKVILSKHSLNPFRVTDDILKEVLSIGIHKKCQCGHCKTIFDTFHELEHHNSMEHSDLVIISNEVVDKKRVNIHCEECNVMADQEEYFKHLEEHSFQFKCSECRFQTNVLVELMAHDARAHKSKVVKVRSEEFTNHLKDVHSKSKMIFSNGLVLSIFNLKGTKYDNSSKFAQVLKTLEERVDGLVRKRTETVSRDMVHGKDNDRSVENGRNKEESSDSGSSDSDTDTDTDTDSDTFSMSSDTSTSTSLSLSSSDSSIASHTPLSKSELQAELRKQNELVNNLSITGIPCLRNENLLRIFDRICMRINAPVTQRDVLKIFRTSGPNQPIIVKLKTWTAKANIKRSFKHKDLWSSEIVSLPERMTSTRLFVNLHTTRFYGKMAQIAKYYKKTGIITSYYLCENGLLVRSQDDDKDHQILSKQELLDWIRDVKDRQFKRNRKRDIRSRSEFDTRRSKYRRSN